MRHAWKKPEASEPTISQCRRCDLQRIAGEPGHFEYRRAGDRDWSIEGRAADYPCREKSIDLMASPSGRRLAASALRAGVVQIVPARPTSTNLITPRPAPSHRASYPEQYSHPLCGKLVRWAGGKDMDEIAGTVERVVSSRFGQLVIFEGGDGKTAHAIGSVRLAETVKGKVDEQIDTLLRSRGFERGYYEGGPSMEAPFSEKVRGVRYYLHPRSEIIVLVTVLGTFHVVRSGSTKRRRGAGLGQLVRTLREVR